MDQQKELSTAKTLGIVSLVAAFIFALAGIICGHISLSKYKKLGITEGRGIAKAGLILSYIFTIIGIIYVIGVVVFFGKMATDPEMLEGFQNLQSIPVE